MLVRLNIVRLMVLVLCATVTQQFIAAQAQSDQKKKRQIDTLTSIHGAIKDPLGEIVPDANVELLRENGVVATTGRSGTDGTYRIISSQAGRFKLRVFAKSFEATTTPPRFFPANSDIYLDVTLSTPTLTQEVTVTASGTPTPVAQVGAAVTVLTADDFRLQPQVQDPLREVPGLQITQTGQMGGTTGLNIRGAGTDANKVLIDGIPANAIGGGVEFANIASVGIQSIEVLREPDSALYGSDALAGVVSLTSTRGSTPLPLFTYAGGAGNFHTYHNEVTAGTVYRNFDLYSAFARIDTANNIPNSEFHNATYAGNFGWTPNVNNDLRFTVRHIVVSSGQPNAIAFFGIPDDGQQKEQDDYYNAVWNGDAAPNWHNQIRYGGLRQNGQYNDPAAVGIPDGFGDTDGALVTIKGANGYSVTGQALFYFGGTAPYTFLTQTKRDFVSAQTDYQATLHLQLLGAFKYENESGLSGETGASPSTIQRGNYSYTLQLSGDVKKRIFYTLGTGLEDNGLFGFAATPRASLAYYLVRPSSNGLLTGTKLHGSFGKGIKEPSVFQQTDSIYDQLTPQQIAKDGIAQLGPVNSRNFDGGVEQEFVNGRARVGVTYFHNEFTNGVEYVPQIGLLALGVKDALSLPYGAYVNSLALRSQGIEVESEYRFVHHLFARAGYTYTAAIVQHSFSSDALMPTFNTAANFATVPIGVYSPLVGARPFRIAPHTAYFGFNYTRPKFYASLTGTLVGKRDDSDFLTDASFGNSLLLPNRNLLGSYQRLDLGVGYQLTPRLNLYTNVQNLLSEHYYGAFGFPSLPLTFRAGVRINFGGESWKLN